MINPLGFRTAHVDHTAAPKTVTTAGGLSTASTIDAPTAAQSGDVNNASVTLSGMSIMLSRLFHTQDADAQPPVISASAGPTRASLRQDPVAFLTGSDRALVSDMYAYAQQQGADLVYVDTLAITLGTYRQFNDGQSLGGFNETQFDSEGHQLAARYSASDTVAANRIMKSDAMQSTRLDPGFVQTILQPTHALSNMANIDFMEHMVSRFSDTGKDTPPLGQRFATFSRQDSAANVVVITASKNVVHEAPASQIANINGRWFILDPALLDNPKALNASGLSKAQIADAGRNAGVVALALLDADPAQSNDVTARLLDLLGLDTDRTLP
jgi:hypothetical protein